MLRGTDEMGQKGCMLWSLSITQVGPIILGVVPIHLPLLILLSIESLGLEKTTEIIHLV